LYDLENIIDKPRTPYQISDTKLQKQYILGYNLAKWITN
jgi:hypothetical protein